LKKVETKFYFGPKVFHISAAAAANGGLDGAQKKTMEIMAFLGQFLFKQPKCWCNLSLLPTRVSAQRFNRLFSNQTVENSNIDSPLIQEAAVSSESEAKGSELRTFEELFKKSPFVSVSSVKQMSLRKRIFMYLSTTI